ncbi:MAG: hypothetical protein V1921_01200 [Candidatus Altiarchaeota archaeon]
MPKTLQTVKAGPDMRELPQPAKLINPEKVFWFSTEKTLEGMFRDLIPQLGDRELRLETVGEISKLLRKDGGKVGFPLLKEAMRDPKLEYGVSYVLDEYAKKNPGKSKDAIELLGDGLKHDASRTHAIYCLCELSGSEHWGEKKWAPVYTAARQALVKNMDQLEAGLKVKENEEACVDALDYLLGKALNSDEKTVPKKLAGRIQKTFIKNLDMLRDGMLQKKGMDQGGSYAEAIVSAAFGCDDKKIQKVLDVMGEGFKDEKNQDDLVHGIKNTINKLVKPKSPKLEGWLVDNLPFLNRTWDDERLTGNLDFISIVLHRKEPGWAKLRKACVDTVGRNVRRIEDGFEDALGLLYGSGVLLQCQDEVPGAKDPLIRHLKWEVGDAIDPELALKEWYRSKKGGSGNAYMDNIERIQKLEAKRKGATKALYKEFGIAAPGRYTVDTLVRLYDRIGVKDDRPLIMIALPRDDHNGAFYGNSKHWTDELSKRHNVIITEVGSKFEFAKRVSRITEKYGLVSGLILGGHGTETSINLGGGEVEGDRKDETDDEKANGKAWNQILIGDLAGPGVRKSRKFLTDNPAIVLASCSTGAKDAIGQQISEMVGGRLAAPSEPSSINDVKAKIRDGKVHFTVEWGNEEVGMLYDSGRPTTMEELLLKAR